MLLKQVNVIGMWYGHFYDNGNGKQFQECSQTEYEALGLAGAGAPPVPGKWIGSGHIAKFDTASGLLEENTYCSQGSVSWVNISGSEGVLPTAEAVQFDTALSPVPIM